MLPLRVTHTNMIMIVLEIFHVVHVKINRYSILKSPTMNEFFVTFYNSCNDLNVTYTIHIFTHNKLYSP